MALGPSLCLRMKPFVIRIHTSVRIRPRPKNKPAYLAGSHSLRAIYACAGEVSAARLRTGKPVPDILHGSYLGFPSNLPFHRITHLCLAQALMYNNRAVDISQEKFRLFIKIFSENFVGITEAAKSASPPAQIGSQKEMRCPLLS